MQLLTAHARHVAVDPGASRVRDPPDDAESTSLEDALVVGVGVTPADPDPTGAAVSVARIARQRAAHLSTPAVLLLPTPSPVDRPAGVATTDRTLSAVERWLTAPESGSPDHGVATVERAPAGYHLAVEGSIRGHPHAVERHRVPPDPPTNAPTAPGAAPPTWRRIRAEDEDSTAVDAEDPPDPPEYPRDPVVGATERLASVPGLHRDGTWLPAGVAARRATVGAAVHRLGEPAGTATSRALVIDREAGAPGPWTVAESDEGSGEDRRWIERSAPVTGRPTLHVATPDPAAALAAACEAVAGFAASVGVEYRVAVREDASEGAVASAVEGAVLAGPAPPGDRRVDVAVSDAAAGLPVARCWVAGDDPALVHAAVARPATALAAAHAAADVADRPLPVTLAPTAVRLLPAAPRHERACLRLVDALRERGVRADCDDRQETVADRLDRVDAERVPYHAVVGDRDVGEGDEFDGPLADVALPVVGPDGEQRQRTVDDVAAAIRAATGEIRTVDPTAVPRRVSRLTP